jgi:hypothetical protein
LNLLTIRQAGGGANCSSQLWFLLWLWQQPSSEGDESEFVCGVGQDSALAIENSRLVVECILTTRLAGGGANCSSQLWFLLWFWQQTSSKGGESEFVFYGVGFESSY